MPSSHPLPELMDHLPYRDACVSVTAKFVSVKYPKRSIIDIGANVGDTAALIRSNCENDLILIEASDYYFPFLERNTAKFPNKVTIEKTLLSDGSIVNGCFRHWGGTAFFNEGNGESSIQTRKLSEITTDDVCFIKSDTDGYDFTILLDSLVWISKQRPVILFENQINNSEELAQADQLYTGLFDAGYQHFVIWDDSGRLILTTSSISILKQMNHYLLKIHSMDARKAIANYDVACFYPEDEDVFLKVSNYFTNL
jgi:FkbM family methyltransferase